MPLFWDGYCQSGMLMAVNMNIYAGTTAVLMYRFDPVAVMQAIDLGFRVVLPTDALCSTSDGAHDALVDLFRMRFAAQVEATDKQTAASIRSKRAAAFSNKRKSDD